MPYIKRKQRKNYDPHIKRLTEHMPLCMHPGDLNYIITKLLQKYIELNGVNYYSFNDVLGALEGVKLEMYRRLAAPYENEKKRRNGDVY